MKWIKRVAAVFVTFILITGFVYVILDEPVPSGQAGDAAEALADLMLIAVDYDSWKGTGAISWTFGGRQRHVWDKRRHLAQVAWGNNIVQIDINERLGIVKKGKNAETEEEISELCYQAWKFWANDSFWLNPVVKIKDEGTSRALVTYEGVEALLVTYSKGGVTPGDSYLWFLDDKGLPYKWKMWVNIIPVGGVSTTWEDWIELSTGAKISTSHYNLLTLKLTDVQGEATLIELAGEDIFGDLVKGENAVSF